MAQLSRLEAVVQATRAKTVAKSKAETKKAASEYGYDYGLPGVLPPLNWFDPAGFTTEIDKNKLPSTVRLRSSTGASACLHSQLPRC